MPMKLKVGLAKKVGQPDFGSLGASCDIELELDGGLLFHDLDGLHEKVRAAYVACRQAVNDELASQRQAPEPRADFSAKTNGQSRTAGSSHPQPASGNGDPRTHGGHSANGKRRPATTSQVRALHAIATRLDFNLTDRLQELFNVYRAEDLSVKEAGLFIEDLNADLIALPAGANGEGGQA